MRLSAAQISPVQGAIHDNLEMHCHFIERAAQEGAELILFPELSITGYVREQAQKLALTHYDASINVLIDFAERHSITVIAGAPVLIKKDLFIGSYVIGPDGAVSIYTKQFLHDGEKEFYKSSTAYNPKVALSTGQHGSNAICFDIEQAEHAMKAKIGGADLYLASIFYTPGGIRGAYDKLSTYASTHSMAVMMANFSGSCYGFQGGGCSAFWDEKGHLVGALDAETPGILLVEKTKIGWQQLK